MSFVSSPIGVVILGLAIGLLTNVLYVVLNLESAARWLRMCMGAVCTFWWESLCGRLVATGKQSLQWSPDPEDLRRRKAALDQQYSTFLNASREDPAGANKMEEEPDTSSVSNDEGVVAYVQLTCAFPEKLVGADGWERVSETVLQKKEVVGKDFLAKAISTLQAALEHDASSTLQIDGWGLFHCKPGGQIQLLKFEGGVHHVPAITSVYGSDIKGLNLYQAAVHVSTQDSSEQLQFPPEVELTGELDELFVTIPRHYNKPSGVYIMALKSIPGEEELVVRSIATPFLMDRSSGATGLFPWVCTPSTWILLLVSLCCFVVAVYYYTIYSKSTCARDRKRIVEHYLLTSRHQVVLPSRVVYKSLPGLVYKVALMLSAVILLGAIMKNRLHRRLRFIVRRRDLRLPEADNDLRLPESVTVVYHVIGSNGQAVVISPSSGISKLLRRLSAGNASLKVATLRPIKSCSETSPRNQSFSSGFGVKRWHSMK